MKLTRELLLKHGYAVRGGDGLGPHPSFWSKGDILFISQGRTKTLTLCLIGYYQSAISTEDELVAIEKLLTGKGI